MYGSCAFDMSGIYKRKGEEWYLMLLRGRIGAEPYVVGEKNHHSPERQEIHFYSVWKNFVKIKWRVPSVTKMIVVGITKATAYWAPAVC